jgi:hypothetical protein
MKYILPIASIVIFLSAISCKSTRKIQTAIAKKDTSQMVVLNTAHADSVLFIRQVLEKIKSNQITDYKTFSAKLKVNYTNKEGEQPELTVFVRIQKDSKIWVSINATVFKYEGMRVLVTPDSIKLINYKDNIVQLRSISYLQDAIQLPFDFYTLQDFLLGNAVYLDSNVVSYKKYENSIVLMNIGSLFKHLLTVSSGDYILQHSKLDDVDPIRNRTGDILYAGYENKNGLQFSTERRISLSEKSKLDININIKQYSFNETLSFPFNIPKNYKRQ